MRSFGRKEVLVPWAEPVEIVQVVRRLRGGSQAFLVRGNDRASYVAKFSGNPQGNRSLLNECIAHHLLSVLGVATPDIAILRLNDRCQGREELYFSMDQQVQVPITSGLHFGSRCPVDPDRVAIFDFLPRNLISRVTNLNDLGFVFAFDQWVAHQDTRQFVFARQPDRRKTPAAQRTPGMCAWAIDNGMCFGGDWSFVQKTMHTPSPFLDIYSNFDLRESVHRGAQLIQSLPASDLAPACRNVPRDWFEPGDDQALVGMLHELRKRQHGLVACIHAHLAAVEALKSSAI